MTIQKTMRGRVVDMNKLINQNEMAVAVGNVRVNARGDLLGPGGTIIKKHEEVVAEAAQNSVPNQINSRKNIKDQDPEGNE